MSLAEILGFSQFIQEIAKNYFLPTIFMYIVYYTFPLSV